MQPWKHRFWTAIKPFRRLRDDADKLMRRLDKKSPDQLGDDGEIDIFEELKREFPADRITRVKKGDSGADIVHIVLENREECGTILYESKNTDAWREDYVTKLRNDQIAEKAEHAILSTRKLPAGVDELEIREHVIIAKPKRVTVLAKILRQEKLVQNQRLRVSEEDRKQKTDALYSYIISPSFNQHLDLLDDLASKPA